ncbi:MAG: hypothetical protein ACYC8W_10885 [Candidatus Tyrphobacter sp.]
MRSKIVFALFALVALGIAAGRSAPNTAPPPAPAPRATANPLVQAINEERVQLAAQCPAHHRGTFIRAYPDPKYPDSFQMTTIQCSGGFLVEAWQTATLRSGR